MFYYSRLQELKARLHRAEDRITRADTMEDYLTDMQIIQRTVEEIKHLSPQSPGGYSGFQKSRHRNTKTCKTRIADMQYCVLN